MPARANMTRSPASRPGRFRSIAGACALVLAGTILAGCSSTPEVMPYPSLTNANRPATPSDAMTQAEKEAAIAALRAEAQANAERGL